MRIERQRSVAAQIVIGVFVILLGLGFLLDNMGLVDFLPSVHLLPLLLVVFGLIKVVQTRTTQGMLVGAVMIVFGALLTLKGMGLIYLSWRAIWPVMMIVLGFFVVFRSVTRGQNGGSKAEAFVFTPSTAAPGAADDSTINVSAVMGGYVRRITTPDFRGGEVNVILAGCELDLRQSSIQGEAVLNVFALFGGIQIKVPADWTVVLQGTPMMGGFDERTTPPPNGSKRLIVRGYVIMGGMEIRN